MQQQQHDQRLGIAFKLDDLQQSGVNGDVLEDTIARMNAGLNTTISTNGVSISNSRGLTVDGHTLPAERELVLRQDIEFEVDGFLGQGASSVVRKAFNVHAPRTKYAVKIFKIFDESRRHQLMKEVRILFALDCQALVQFYGAYLEDSRVGVILEFMDAGSLEKIIEKHLKRTACEAGVSRHSSSCGSSSSASSTPAASVTPRHTAALFDCGLPERVIAAIVYQVLWGLAYLHFENRLHRDIKPGNVLLNFRGEVKLSDFGISRELSESTDQIASTIVGTFRYMSPERLHGADYSFESDVWSVGIMALDAARGEPVFSTGATPVEIVQLVKDHNFALDAIRDAALSRDFEDFLIACLQTRPEDRPTCDALLRDCWLAQNATLWRSKEPPSIDLAADLLAPWLADLRTFPDTPKHAPRRRDEPSRHSDDLPSKSHNRRVEAKFTSSSFTRTCSRQSSFAGDPLNSTYRSDFGDDDTDDPDRMYNDLAQTIRDDDDD